MKIVYIWGDFNTKKNMKSVEKAGLDKPLVKESSTVKKEKNYVIIDGKKHSRTWAAMMANQGTGTILDMQAVLK
jgi:hypothetical protein